jgi:hypothetical protein
VPALHRWQSEFAAAVLGSGGPVGMAVYRGNVFGNWAQALAGAYPIVRKIVGDEFFRGLARAYASEHPSTSGDLNEYGEHLADFVSRFPHTLDLPYLPDVVRMEWLAHRAYYAEDPAPFDLHDLDERACLRLTRPCALLASDWPLARIWTVHQDDYEGELDVDLRSGPDRILVHRPRWRAQVRSLAPGDYRFLEAIRERTSLEQALEAALAADCAFDPALALARWVDAGAVTT